MLSENEELGPGRTAIENAGDPEALGLTLVSAIDRNYVIPWSVMAASLRDHNPDLKFSAYILHYDLTDDDLKYLHLVAEASGISIEPIRVGAYPFALFETRRRRSLTSRSTMSPIAYVKAFIDRFLPETVTRCLLIDADIVTNGSVKELTTLDFRGPLAAAANIPHKHHNHFNSGVALVNLEEWRRRRISQIAEQFLLGYADALHTHDQHVLNLIFSKEWMRLPLKWNYIEDHYRFKHRNESYSEIEIKEARKSPVFIHYAVSTDKPWRQGTEHPRADLYFTYRSMTEPMRAGLDLVEPS